MRRLRFGICFNGTNYHGWQVQKGVRTVQQTVQDALQKMTGARDNITGCSRTDAGVHAEQFYFHMDTASKIPPEGFRRGLNTMLPPDISVFEVCEAASDFHARYSTFGKEYIYKIWNADQPNPFLQGMAWHYDRPIRVERIRRSLPYLLGEHDFTSFCAQGSSVKDKVRAIYSADVDCQGRLVILRFYGNGFLYHMVRILTGTLVEISEGRMEPEQLADILRAQSRDQAGRTCPPQGLYLHKVVYAVQERPPGEIGAASLDNLEGVY